MGNLDLKENAWTPKDIVNEMRWVNNEKTHNITLHVL